MKIRQANFLYSIASISYVSYSILATSTIRSSFPSIGLIFQILKIIVGICIFIKAVSMLRKSNYRFLKILIPMVVVLIVFLQTNNQRLLYLTCFIFLAFDVTDKEMVKPTLVTLIVCTLLVVILAQLGVIENYQYNRSNLAFSAESYAMGFDYYSYLPMFVLHGCIMFTYLKKRLSLYNYVIMLTIMYVTNQLCQKRLTFYIGIIFLIGHYLIVNNRKFNLSNKVIRRVSTVLPTFFFGLTIFITLRYGQTNSYIDVLFNGRLGFGKKALLMYPIRLFGNVIQMYGGSAIDTQSTNSYFYIDSGYVYSLLGNGIIYTLLLLVALTMFIRLAANTNDKQLWWWLVIVLIYNVLGDTFITIAYNPILLLSVSVLLRKNVNNRGYANGKKYIIG